MSRPIDPTVLGAMSKLLPALEHSPSMIPRFREGGRGADLVGHLILEMPHRLAELDLFLPITPAELFLSRQGTLLLHLAEQQRSRFAAPGPASEVKLFVYAELRPRTKDNAAPDIFSSRVFEVVSNPKVEDLALETAVSDLLFFFTPSLSSALNYPEKQLESMLRDGIAEAKAGLFQVAASKALEVAAMLVSLIREAALKIASFLRTNSRMPPELWNPGKRPKDWKSFLDKLPGKIRQRIAAVREELDGYRIDLSRLLKSFPGSGFFRFLGDIAARIDSSWNGALDFLTGVIDSITELLPEPTEVIDATLGYLSGFWDGIMDAVIGIFETVALAAMLLAALLRAGKNVERAINAFLEAVDEMLQALSRIEWPLLLDWFVRAARPLWNAATERSSAAFRRIASHTAQAAYYFGYAVYMIVEYFLPPLKFSSLVRNGRRLQSTSFLAKVFA